MLSPELLGVQGGPQPTIELTLAAELSNLVAAPHRRLRAVP